MELVSSNDLILFIQNVPAELKLMKAPFVNLRALTLNNYRRANSPVIRKIARGELLPRLTVLCCNYVNLQSTAFRLQPTEYAELKELYSYLVNDRQTSGAIRPELSIYIHGLLFDPRRTFETCGYFQSLVQCHFNSLNKHFGVQTLASVTTAEYVELLDTFLTIPDGAKAIFGLYPNLRVIALENLSDRLVSADTFLQFLGTCFGITELVLRFANFDSGFYDRLLQMPCLFALDTFVLFERGGIFKHLLDLEFLQQIKHLRHFHTNVANQTVMLQIVNQIKINQRFLFEFHRQSDEYLECEFWRKLGTYHDLRVELRNHGRPKSKRVFWKTFENLAELMDFFARPNPYFALSHWLDFQTSKNVSF